MSLNNRFITSAESLITTHEETRAGFLSIALEKNRVGDPYVKNALAFKAMVAHTQEAEDLLTIPEVRPFLITAAGLSDKSLSYLDEADQTMAIQGKTGNSALHRIRTSFAAAGYPGMKTSFIGAAIERSMAEEIYQQLEDKTLSNASNLTNYHQLIEYCNWLIEL